MVAFLSILLTVALLGLTVYGLHRYQEMEVEFTVDRTVPLPPLSHEPLYRKNDPSLVSASPAETPAQLQSTKNESTNWLETASAYRNEGNYDAALAACEQALPLWGAFNQACIVQRARIKMAQDEGSDFLAQLQKLYALATIAELLHDKSGEYTHLTLGQLKKLDITEISQLDMPYSEIGYQRLRLIQKNDIKLLLSTWGRPTQHLQPRHFHGDWWKQKTSSVS